MIIKGKMYMSKVLKYQQGISILEILISMAVGLVLFAGVLSVFVGIRTTTEETSSYGEMQENGRFAINVLTDDLLRQGFWGDLSVEMDASVLENPAPVVGGDCSGAGINNNSFPQVAGHFRTLWGTTVASANIMGCITDASLNSDLIQIKRVISSPLPAPVAPAANRYYVMSNANSAEIFAGTAALPTIDNSQVWEYQHHIYYVRNDTQGSNTVPVLMQGILRNGTAPPILFQPLVEGIEMVRFMYGVDTDLDADTADYGTGVGDGDIDAFIPARNMTQALWENDGSRILAVKMYVLVRSIMPDPNYENTNTYQLGGSAVQDQFVAPGDNYRRLLFSSTVSLHNARMGVWN